MKVNTTNPLSAPDTSRGRGATVLAWRAPRVALVTLAGALLLLWGLAPASRAAADCPTVPSSCQPPDGTTAPLFVPGPALALTAYLEPKHTREARRLYRRLIPRPYEVAQDPMVRVHFWRLDGLPGQRAPADITDTSQPYLEDGISLRVVYHGMVGWYLLSMPLNSYAGWYGGTYIGYPKYLATMAFDSSGQGWQASASVQGRPTMTIKWWPARTHISDALANDTLFKYPGFTLAPALTGPGLWQASLSVIPPLMTPLNEPQTGLAHITLDPNLNRVDAETPTPLPHLFGPCESLANLVNPNQTVPATFWQMNGNAILNQQKIGSDGGYDTGPPKACKPTTPPHRPSHRPKHGRRHPRVASARLTQS